MAIVRKLTKRERLIAFATCLMLLGALAYVHAIEPAALRWFEARHRAQQAVDDLAKLHDLAARRSQIEQEYEELEGAVTVGRSAEQLRVELLREAEQIARECGLDVNSVKPAAMRKEGLFERHSVQLNARCEGHELVKCLLEMQRPEHLLNVELMSVVVGRTRPPLTLTLSISKLTRTEAY